MPSTVEITSIGDWNFNQRTSSLASFTERLASAREQGAILGTKGGQHNVAIVGDWNFQQINQSPIFLPAGAGPRPPEIDEVVASAQSQIIAISGVQLAAISDGQKSCGTDQTCFIAKMEAARTAAKVQSDKVIDSAYASLKSIGEQNPSAQPLILQAAGQLSALLSSADSAVDKACSTALSGMHDAADAVAAAAEAAASAVSNGARTAADGIKKIFSGW